jgi:hypothetical protein
MPSIEARLKDLLDETRLVMLGTQVLIGLQYQAAFRPEFDRLPDAFRWFDCLALFLILATAGILLATPSFHHITEKGHATGRIVAIASRNLKLALLPLGLALGMDVAIILVAAIGAQGAAAAGAAFVLGAWIAWYWVPFRAAAGRKRGEDHMEDREQSLQARIDQALTELRVILPGAQALFGFQFIAVLSASFDQLSAVSKAVHLLSTALVALAIILLIAPAAYHRIAARGEAEERVLRYTVRLMLPAEGLIALGMTGDAYVTIRKVSGMPGLALGAGIAALLGFAVLLYGVPLMARRAGGGDLIGNSPGTN